MKVTAIVVVESAYDIDLDVPEGTPKEHIEAMALDEFNNNAYRYTQTSADTLYSHANVESVQTS